jgi:hypothetical protein
MDDAVNRLAREMADAIAAAVANDPRIGACHARARAEGYELRVSLEAVIGFAPHPAAETPGEVPAEATGTRVERSIEITPHDRRFLRSLRIAVDETIHEP